MDNVWVAFRSKGKLSRGEPTRIGMVERTHPKTTTTTTYNLTRRGRGYPWKPKGYPQYIITRAPKRVKTVTFMCRLDKTAKGRELYATIKSSIHLLKDMRKDFDRCHANNVKLGGNHDQGEPVGDRRPVAAAAANHN